MAGTHESDYDLMGDFRLGLRDKAALAWSEAAEVKRSTLIAQAHAFCRVVLEGEDFAEPTNVHPGEKSVFFEIDDLKFRYQERTKERELYEELAVLTGSSFKPIDGLVELGKQLRIMDETKEREAKGPLASAGFTARRSG